MEAVLVIILSIAGSLGIGLAVPQVDMESCQESLNSTRMDTNAPMYVEVQDVSCMSKQDFLKLIGEQET